MPGGMYPFEGMLYQLDRLPNGQFYCRIYQPTTLDVIATTFNYDEEETAVAEAKEKIRHYQKISGEE
jgi:hypothetical protein